MELIMSGLKRGQVRAFHARPLRIAKLKECLVLINRLKPGNEAALLEVKARAAGEVFRALRGGEEGGEGGGRKGGL